MFMLYVRVICYMLAYVTKDRMLSPVSFFFTHCHEWTVILIQITLGISSEVEFGKFFGGVEPFYNCSSD